MARRQTNDFACGSWDGTYGRERLGRVLRERGAVGDEAHAADDEQDAGPAVDSDRLVLPVLREKSDHNIAKGRGWQHEGQVGPTERGEIAGKEAEQAKDSGNDPRVADGGQQQTEVRERDGPDLRHRS